MIDTFTEYSRTKRTDRTDTTLQYSPDRIGGHSLPRGVSDVRLSKYEGAEHTHGEYENLSAKRIQETAVCFRTHAVESGMIITPDDRVREADAATLLGLQPNSLKEKRLDQTGPRSYRHGVGDGRSRFSYKLADLAEWLERTREDNYFDD